MQQQSQSPPYTIRHSQSLGAQTPEKAQLLEAGGALSNDKQGQEHLLLSPERRESEQLSSEASGPQQAQSPLPAVSQSPLKQHHQHQQVR